MGQAGDDVTGLLGGALQDAELIGAVGLGHGDGVIFDYDGVAMPVVADDKGIAAGVPGEGDAARKFSLDGDIRVDPIGLLTGQKQQWCKRYE